ncbi:MAG: glycosyltransferase [Polynucleobacter sp.]|nr:glycosyltransferase [Polynucleobacter sp.]
MQHSWNLSDELHHHWIRHQRHCGSQVSAALAAGTVDDFAASLAMPDISFVTTCKGRLEHLRQTLPRMATQPDCECIVVDYDCPDGTAGWVEENFPAVKIVKVAHAPRFHKSHAQNLGAAAASAPWLCLIDADILIDPSFRSVLLPYLKSGFYFRPRPLDWNAYGSFICGRSDFESAYGYDEAIEGCSCMDDDLYARLEMAGLKSAAFPGDQFVGIDHDDALRTRYYEIRDRPLNQRINAMYANIKHDLMRASAGKDITMALRRSIYAEVKKAVLAADASGRECGKIELKLPASSTVPLQHGWEIQRKWIFSLVRTPPPAATLGDGT